MALKNEEELLEELKTYVRDGEKGKTTAESLRTFLRSLISELTTLAGLVGGSIGRFRNTSTILLTKDPISNDVTADLHFSDSPDIKLIPNSGGAGIQAFITPELRSSLQTGGIGQFKNTNTIYLTKNSITNDITADLRFGNTEDIELRNPSGPGILAYLTPDVRNGLVKFVNGAADGRFLLYSGGKTYAFVSARQAVDYAKANTLAGIFVFRSNVTDSIELLHNCTYDITGFDSEISSGNLPNFYAVQTPGGVRANLKARRIMRNGNAGGTAISIKGTGTEVNIECDIIIDSSSTGGTYGIIIEDGAKLRYKGNIEGHQNISNAVRQIGANTITNIEGNVLINSPTGSSAIVSYGGVLDFTGRIDVLKVGGIAEFSPSVDANPLMRLHLLGATSKSSGISVVGNNSLGPARLCVKGIIDMRESVINKRPGLGANTTSNINIQFENVTILTNPGTAPLQSYSFGVHIIHIIGKFYTTEYSSNSFTFQNVTPISIP